MLSTFILEHGMKYEFTFTKLFASESKICDLPPLTTCLPQAKGIFLLDDLWNLIELVNSIIFLYS